MATILKSKPFIAKNFTLTEDQITQLKKLETDYNKFNSGEIKKVISFIELGLPDIITPFNRFMTIKQTRTINKSKEDQMEIFGDQYHLYEKYLTESCKTGWSKGRTPTEQLMDVKTFKDAGLSIDMLTDIQKSELETILDGVDWKKFYDRHDALADMLKYNLPDLPKRIAWLDENGNDRGLAYCINRYGEIQGNIEYSDNSFNRINHQVRPRIKSDCGLTRDEIEELLLPYKNKNYDKTDRKSKRFVSITGENLYERNFWSSRNYSDMQIDNILKVIRNPWTCLTPEERKELLEKRKESRKEQDKFVAKHAKVINMNTVPNIIRRNPTYTHEQALEECKAIHKSKNPESKTANNFFEELQTFLSIDDNDFFVGYNDNGEEYIGDYFVDCFIPSLGLVVEFYGDRWHGNPKIYGAEAIIGRKTAKAIWEFDKNREAEIRKDSRVKDVLIVWEYDYKNNKHEIFEQFKQYK